MKKHTIFAGLDAHKDSIDTTLANGGREGNIRLYGTIGGDLESMQKVIR